MTEAYLLDTSAIFALTDNEPGADTVEQFVAQAEKGRLALHISSMTAMELYYVCLEERGEEEANRLLILVRALPVAELPLEDSLVLPAAKIKANCKVSVADAWIAATAIVHGLSLVHKDPEFESLQDKVPLIALPYKPAKGK